MSDRLEPVLAGVAAKVASLGLSVAGTALPVRRQKAPIRRQKLDPPAMITVCKSPAPDETSRRRFGLWQTTYAVAVTVAAPYNGADGPTAEYSAIRDAIVDALKAPPLPGAPAVFDLDAQPADWMRPTGETTEYDWLSVEVRATVAHN